MTNQEFTKLWREITSKFPELEGAYMMVVNNGDIHQATNGSVVEIIKAIVECGMNDRVIMSIFVTIGEMLKSKVGDEQFDKDIRKLFLEKKLENSSN